jgi:Domain of unknown function (DUF4160)
MPVISRFFGIVVYMNYNEHNPPHFHARYQFQQVSIEIRSGRVTGEMATRALQMLQEWRSVHYEALLATWDLARDRLPLAAIPPLT